MHANEIQYLVTYFFLVSKVAFTVIKSNQNIDKLRIFEYGFLYTAYANDTTLFIKNQTSVIEIVKVFNQISNISGLKPNKSKCEITVIGALKD